MNPKAPTIRPWHVVLLCAALALLLSVVPPPAGAHHCKGPHAGAEGCEDPGGGGGGEEPDPDFRPEIVGAKPDGSGIVAAEPDSTSPIEVYTNNEDVEGFRLGGPVTFSWNGRAVYSQGSINLGRKEGYFEGIWRLELYDAEDKFAPGQPVLVTDTEIRANHMDVAPVLKPDGSGDDVEWLVTNAAHDACPDSDWDLFLINLSTGERHNITNTCGIRESFPTWSPDGSRVAATEWVGDQQVSDIKVYSINFQGTRPTVYSITSLLRDNEGDLPPEIFEATPNNMDWSPADPNLILLTDAHRGGVYFIPPDPAIVAKSTIFVPSPEGVGRAWNKWSPDGKSLLILESALPDNCARSPVPEGTKRNHPLVGEEVWQMVIENITITRDADGLPTGATISCTKDAPFEGIPDNFWYSWGPKASPLQAP